MTTRDPATTFRLFQHDRVADGYRSARPNLHPDVFARVRGLLGLQEPVARALDVGCGTGMSAVALLALARQVVGVDSSTEMLLRATPLEGVRYVASAAETPPFRGSTFGLVLACGSIDWIDRSSFLPVVHELLTPGGWLVPLDFGDAGRSCEVPALESWHDGVFLRRYPRPGSADPMIAPEEAAEAGFGGPVEARFVIPWRITAAQYADFLMTESNVIAAIEYGRETAAEVRAWLGTEVGLLFGDRPAAVEFAGYIQALRKA